MGTTASRTPSSPARPMRVLVVDDHPIVRQGYALLIDDQPHLEVCGETEGLTDTLQLMNQVQPDLVLVDISLKDGNGIELIKEVRARSPETRMLVCSMHDESLYAERALRAGATGYINKQEATDRLVEAIESVLKGKLYLSDAMTERLLSRSVGSLPPTERSPMENLSDRELEVFELIGRGDTTRQIAQKLHLSPKTVETYRENIKQKLNLTNATELTRHAVRWVLEDS